MQTVGNKCQVYILLKGLVDVPREVERIEERIKKLKTQIDKLISSMNIPDYEKKVGNPLLALPPTCCPSLPTHPPY